MYLLLLILGVLLIAFGISLLVRRPRNVLGGVVCIVLGLLALPGGLMLNG